MVAAGLPSLGRIGMTSRPVGALAAVILCLAALPAVAAELVIKRVVLSAGGVAYVEREAEVDGNAELALDLPLDQVDDVLKSVVVYDSSGGLGSAHLPGREPVAQIFADLPFGAEALSSPVALLNALQGAEIRIGGSHPVTGRLLKVVPETARLGDQTIVERNRLSVLTAIGLQEVVLEEADDIAFTDADLQAKVERALDAIAQHRAKDRRRIVLTARGSGKRLLRVGYVVAAPLWKSAYRLTLPQDPAKPSAHLQGWAVLENMSGEDWHEIELTVLSGRPVSFYQALYQAYYVNRPEMPVEVAGRILATPDTGVLGKPGGGAFGNADARQRLFAKQQKQQNNNTRPSSHAESTVAPAEEPAPAPDMAAAIDVAEAQEGVTQVAFRLPVPVSIKSGDSAIVPIVDRDFPVERLSLHQPGIGGDHPLAALRLSNDGANGLPPGVLTLYQAAATGSAYIGDAHLGSLPAGENRLLSYALDEKTKIAREEQIASTLTRLVAARGTLSLSHTQRRTVRYKIAAPQAQARRLILELPKQSGWTLADPAEDETPQTATGYRIGVDLKPGEDKTVTVVLQRTDWQQNGITAMKSDDIVAVTSSAEIDGKAKRALEELLKRRQTLADKDAARQQIKDESQAIGNDQQRIRANLVNLNRDGGLYKRYTEKLNEQETRLEKLQELAAAAAQDWRAAKAALDDYVAKLEP
jgi:hypothetical protein